MVSFTFSLLNLLSLPLVFGHNQGGKQVLLHQRNKNSFSTNSLAISGIYTWRSLCQFRVTSSTKSSAQRPLACKTSKRPQSKNNHAFAVRIPERKNLARITKRMGASFHRSWSRTCYKQTKVKFYYQLVIFMHRLTRIKQKSPLHI